MRCIRHFASRCFPTRARAGGFRIPYAAIVTLPINTCVTIYITILGENRIGRQSAKTRQFFKQKTRQMRDPLWMIHS